MHVADRSLMQQAPVIKACCSSTVCNHTLFSLLPLAVGQLVIPKATTNNLVSRLKAWLLQLVGRAQSGIWGAVICSSRGQLPPLHPLHQLAWLAGNQER